MGRWIVFSRLEPGREAGGAGSGLDCKRGLRRPRRNCPGRLYPDTAATATWGSRPPWTESPSSLCCEPGPPARCRRLFPAVGCSSRASLPRPALPEGEGRLTRGGQLHPGPGAGQWRSEGPEPVAAAVVSLRRWSPARTTLTGGRLPARR